MYDAHAFCYSVFRITASNEPTEIKPLNLTQKTSVYNLTNPEPAMS